MQTAGKRIHRGHTDVKTHRQDTQALQHSGQTFITQRSSYWHMSGWGKVYSVEARVFLIYRCTHTSLKKRHGKRQLTVMTLGGGHACRGPGHMFMN